MKILSSIILTLFTTIYGFSQLSVNEQLMPAEPLFQYNMRPFTFSHSENLRSDTIWHNIDIYNYCRIKTCEIKNVKVYDFENISDSTLRKTVIYNRTGLIDTVIPGIGWQIHYDVHIYDTIDFNCEKFIDTISLNKPILSNETLVFKHGSTKTIYRYDSLGYLIEKINIKRGLIKNGYTWFKLTNFKEKYVYSNNYKTIKKYYCHLDKGNVIKKGTYSNDYFLYELDDNLNLIFELYVKVNDAGIPIDYSGNKYFYEYFNNQ